MAIELSRGGRVSVWDLPLRLFHWLLVGAVALAFLSAEEDSPLNKWHVMAGWTAGILIVFRVVWGFVGGEHSRFASFLRPAGIPHHVRDLFRRRVEPSLGHNPLGALAVLALLGIAAATVWTGAALAGELHELLGWTLLGIVAVHVAAVVLMSCLAKENLVRAMITGTKPAIRHPGATEARRPGPAAFVLAFIVVAATVYGVLHYDPQAFAPRTTEAYEHRLDVTGGAAEREHDRPEEGRGRGD